MENSKRVILIGRSTAGKTTLCQFLGNKELNYHKTQTIQVMNGCMIDTPGEYLERRYMRGPLQVTAADAELILLVQDATEGGTMFPPAYASSFAKPCIGIVTKSDIATEEQIEKAREFLKAAGATEIYVTSSVAGTGFQELLEALSR